MADKDSETISRLSGKECSNRFVVPARGLDGRCNGTHAMYLRSVTQPLHLLAIQKFGVETWSSRMLSGRRGICDGTNLLLTFKMLSTPMSPFHYLLFILLSTSSWLFLSEFAQNVFPKTSSTLHIAQSNGHVSVLIWFDLLPIITVFSTCSSCPWVTIETF